MPENLAQLNEYIFKELSKPENVEFLNNIENKRKNIENQLSEIEIKRAKILKNIEDGKNTVKDPKELRIYINNFESVLESVDEVYKNLSEILNKYRSAEKTINIISKKIDINPSDVGINNDASDLLYGVKELKLFEERIKEDNQKNYLIIDSFLDRTLNYSDNYKLQTNNENITSDSLSDNLVLKICEKRVELPYTKKEIEGFINTYPDHYKTVQDVISKEFIMNISVFNKHPVLSRFKEAYYLCRTKEMMSIFESFNYAKSIMFKSNLNSYIIAAVKSKKQLEDYIECMENNRLDNFKHFKIIYSINPLSV